MATTALAGRCCCRPAPVRLHAHHQYRRSRLRHAHAHTNSLSALLRRHASTAVRPADAKSSGHGPRLHRTQQTPDAAGLDGSTINQTNMDTYDRTSTVDRIHPSRPDTCTHLMSALEEQASTLDSTNQYQYVPFRNILEMSRDGTKILANSFDIDWMYAQIQAQLPNCSVPILQYRQGEYGEYIRAANGLAALAIQHRHNVHNVHKHVPKPMKWIKPPYTINQETPRPVQVIVVDPTTSTGLAVGENNWLILVHKVLLGETVIVKPTSHYLGFSVATLLRVVKPSHDRVQPPCKYFNVCNGCTLQHISYDSQLKNKRQAVLTKFSKYAPSLRFIDHSVDQDDLGKPARLSDVVAPVVPSIKPLQYRSSFRPYYSECLPGTSVSKVGTANFAKRVEVVDIDSCLLNMPEIDREYRLIRDATLKIHNSGEMMRLSGSYNIRRTLLPPTGMSLQSAQEALVASRLALEASNASDSMARTSVASGWRSHAISNNKDAALEIVDGVSFRFVIYNFFQPNVQMLPLMTQHMREAIRRYFSAPINGQRVLIDAYSGVGLFGLTLAHLFDKVVGFDIDRNAVSSANSNAHDNGIAHASYVHGISEQLLPVALSEHDPASTVLILSPDFTGTHNIILETIRKKGPKMILYVSSNLDTMAAEIASIAGDPYARSEWASDNIRFFPSTSLRPLIYDAFRGKGMPSHTKPTLQSYSRRPHESINRGFGFTYGYDYGGHDYRQYNGEWEGDPGRDGHRHVQHDAKYSIASITPFDMFAQTRAVMCVAVLVRDDDVD